MRIIALEYADYDSVNGESWTSLENGFLLTPHIVLTSGQTGFGFFCFKEAIGDDQSSVGTDRTRIIDFTISGANVESIDLEKLANMTVAELAGILATQIN